MICFLFFILLFNISFTQPVESEDSKDPSGASGYTPKQSEFPSLQPLTQSLPISSQPKDEEKEMSVRPKDPQQKHKHQRFPSRQPFPSVLNLPNFKMCRGYKIHKNRFHTIMFVKFWPGEKCSGITCSLPLSTLRVKEEFFLHGFWPEFTANQNMVCCRNKFLPVDVERKLIANQELFQEIRQNWMSIESCLLALYQWDKHGTCSTTTYGGPEGPIDYIKTALFLNSKFEFWKVLRESELKVEPNTLYDIEELRSVLSKTYDIHPTFVCVDMTSVLEIRICFDAKRNKLNPNTMPCPEKIFKEEKKRCAQKVMFKEFPEYLLNPETAPRNNCPY
ncbi:hypothetical protein EIN_276130 [Entamoeba invadens IP1]|uniref:Uncharacterized protein n=1 Tax=Entamoeba invadens IP1 TaxID=370355 RepID=A0A0A1UBE7_ENTIV|nr:hypothetical protein EIN_276130 [Entamoeba invadens IP1]ELP92524.1 hypothetical protein EIN_276130 [Entamoeba invadens IP1]|eukprot:XP_004259295.1 hypothetical protein EIN_276130 [Entamoeba invadens IP1]